MNTTELYAFEKSFHLANGKTLRSFHELVDYAQVMPADVFKYHVNDEKNDFVNWIKDVIRDEKLAKSLNRVKKHETFVKKLNESLSKN